MTVPFMAVYDPVSDKGTLAGGGWAASLPLTNLQSERLSRRARSLTDSPDDTQLRAVLPEALQLMAVIVAGTNLSTAHQYRIRIYKNATFDPDDGGDPGSGENLSYDSGWVAASTRAVFGSLPWGDPHLWSGYTPFDDPERRLDIIHLLPQAVTSQFVSIEINDAGNPAGYVELSRLLLGKTFQPSINYSYDGNGLTFEDNSQAIRTMSGGELRRRRVNPRVFSLALQYIPDSEAFSAAYDFFRYCGYDREVYIIPDPTATGLTLQRRSFLGTISQMSPLAQAIFDHTTTGFTVKERLV